MMATSERMMASSVSSRRQTTDMFPKVSSLTMESKFRRVSSSDDLHRALCCLPLDQIDQKVKARRVYAVIDFLEDVQACRILVKECSQHGEEAQRSIRYAIGRYDSCRSVRVSLSLRSIRSDGSSRKFERLRRPSASVREPTAERIFPANLGSRAYFL